jgi:hypothetical protein
MKSTECLPNKASKLSNGVSTSGAETATGTVDTSGLHILAIGSCLRKSSVNQGLLHYANTIAPTYGLHIDLRSGADISALSRNPGEMDSDVEDAEAADLAGSGSVHFRKLIDLPLFNADLELGELPLAVVFFRYVCQCLHLSRLPLAVVQKFEIATGSALRNSIPTGIGDASVSIITSSATDADADIGLSRLTAFFSELRNTTTAYLGR